ncbi:hypothetical protein B296_00006156 [Ensete ventricosum]|uniref:Uncharacterized protein n=1 Tax=Ensete ventricosum TaxID=4639 RepID=A0A426ZSF8_ENSVE|nr:hypothetical protein B296_00006156 [Ensete ventricosum]
MQVLLPSGGTSRADGAALHGCCPLQEWPPLQAVALATGLPLAASQRAVAPYGLVVGAAYASRHQPCPWATAHVGDCPCKGPWPQPAWLWWSLLLLAARKCSNNAINRANGWLRFLLRVLLLGLEVYIFRCCWSGGDDPSPSSIVVQSLFL